MRQVLIILTVVLSILSVKETAVAQRVEDATQWVGAAAGAMSGGAAGSGGSLVVDKILELYGLDLLSVQDNGRWASSLVTNLNEFEKILAYDKNIQEIYINTESTAEEGKNATKEALGKMPVSDEFKELVTGETGNGVATTSQASSSSAQEEESNVSARSQETKAPMGRLDKKQSSRKSAINYVKENFFYKQNTNNNNQKIEDLEIEKIQNKRDKLVRDVILDALTYSQLYKANGKKDFEERLKAIKEAQNQAKTETEVIATNTMALKNVLQETMLQVALEQKLLKLEAAKNLMMQNVLIVEAGQGAN